MSEERRAAIEKNIEGIQRRLEDGTYTIKEGHRVQHINEDGVELTRSLTERMIEERLQKLAEQQEALKRPSSQNPWDL